MDLNNIIGKNWRTTLIGLLAAIWLAVQPLIAHDNFILSRDWKSLVYAAIAASFGFLTKDFNVTGGTVANVPNDASVVKETTKTDK